MASGKTTPTTTSNEGTPTITAAQEGSDATTTTALPLYVETLPPTHPQRPTSDSDAAADKHNASILAVRGLHTTATGHELYRLAWSACQNIGVPSTTEAESRTPHGSSPGPGRPFEVAFEPFYFFFYGSLQIPSVLRAVCGITSSEEGIDLGAEASITGWRLRKWGPYPALMPDAGGLVRGVAWWCDKPEYVPQLCYYETGAYRMAYCTLSLCVADPVLPDRVGETTVGNARTFVWARDAGELEDGVFDVAEYRARAGRW